MSDSPCCCVIDTGGLHEIARASGNLRTVALDMLKKGIFAVPTWAWKELKDVYPEDADELEAYVTERVYMSKSVSVRAAQIAEKLNSGFSKGPYDNHTGLLTAAVATNNGFRVITGQADLSSYGSIGCEAWTVEIWITEFEKG